MTTLRDLSGLGHTPKGLSESALIVIDCQNTYIEGVMALEGVEEALLEVRKVLDLAREHSIPIFHIQHDGGEGSPYDINASIGEIIEDVTPIDGEYVITKSFPNSFIQTSLDEALRKRNIENVILVGFMTHMCVSSTAHGAFNRGYTVTVIGNATATRALSTNTGGIVDAESVQEVTLASLRDMYAAVIESVEELPVT
ncbi:MAG TPA: cysteine hydrolase [Methylophaga aminisulfidivorans]|uniref:Cysteine hydrolase n=1 Tax=Methylophaga aminisulfidivorans TaxID=230105 RepID=A0A7C1VVJ0_9GAMM|nr:cysteine hydrolase [Methylophaga sp.]HEC72779.1 cysteine hydrolase [Methylophaga aminisulfidivorans]